MLTDEVKDSSESPELDGLLDRLDKNFEDYRGDMLTKGAEHIFNMAYEIDAFTDMHYYLTETASLGQDTVEKLLQFENPLKIAADAWITKREDISDVPYVVDGLFSDMDSINRIYASMPRENPPDSAPDIHGYKILKSVEFSNDRGFTLAENLHAVSPYVTWQYTVDDGDTDHYWGHYFQDKDKAEEDFNSRVAEYKETNKVSERNLSMGEKPSIIQRLQEAKNVPEKNNEAHQLANKNREHEL